MSAAPHTPDATGETAPALIMLEETASTNDAVVAAALARPPDARNAPLWLVAHRQTAGRGRRGRVWSAGAGDLFLSGWRRVNAAPAAAAQLSFAAALAVAELVEAHARRGAVRVKWPNDVLVDGAKIAGILLESTPLGAGDGQDDSVALVLGMGVNLRSGPQGLDRPTARLADLCEGAPPTPAAAARFIISRFEALTASWAQDGFTALRTPWLARAAWLGETIRVSQGNDVLEGVFEDLDADGALVLRVADGHKRITAGEVFAVFDDE